MIIHNVHDASFRPYGRIIHDIDVSGIMEALKNTECPDDHTIYVASDPSLENTDSGKEMQQKVYGELPVQIGYCNGYNVYLNALEYHRSSEINIAENDLILLLGKQQDISDDFHYDTSRVEAFLVPAGTIIEVYATTLHYAPCSVIGKPFRCVVVLPKGTNTELTASHGGDSEDKLLTAVNKWLIAHKDAKIEGAFNGLTGENLRVD
ncbi:MAG: DUF4867 family protein [Bilifractor sp.]